MQSTYCSIPDVGCTSPRDSNCVGAHWRGGRCDAAVWMVVSMGGWMSRPGRAGVIAVSCCGYREPRWPSTCGAFCRGLNRLANQDPRNQGPSLGAVSMGQDAACKSEHQSKRTRALSSPGGWCLGKTRNRRREGDARRMGGAVEGSKALGPLREMVNCFLHEVLSIVGRPGRGGGCDNTIIHRTTVLAGWLVQSASSSSQWFS